MRDISKLIFCLMLTNFGFEPTFADDGDDYFMPDNLKLDSHWRKKVKQEKIGIKFNQYVTRRNRTPLKDTLYVQPTYQYKDKIVSFKLFSNSGKFYKPDIKNRKNYIGFLVFSIKLNPINESGNTVVTDLMNAMSKLKIQSDEFASEVVETNSKIVMTNFMGDFATANYEISIDGIVFNSLNSGLEKWNYNLEYSYSPYVLKLTQTLEQENVSKIKKICNKHLKCGSWEINNKGQWIVLSEEGAKERYNKITNYSYETAYSFKRKLLNSSDCRAITITVRNNSVFKEYIEKNKKDVLVWVNSVSGNGLSICHISSQDNNKIILVSENQSPLKRLSGVIIFK